MSLILDSIIIVMLTATIFYSVRLSAKLNVIKNQKEELAKNLAAFAAATDNAIVAVEELQVKGEKICKEIDNKVKRAQITADDIEFLIDRAAKRVKEFEGKMTPAQTKQSQKLAGYSEAELVKLLRLKQSNLAG